MKQESKNLSSEIILIQEAWLHQDEPLTKFILPCLQIHSNSYGRGKGVCCYYSQNFTPVSDICTEEYQISVMESVERIILNVYISQDSNLTLFSVDVLKLLKNLNQNKETFIAGDFNFCYATDQTNHFKKEMENAGFKQLVTKPTHEAGHLLDQIYVLNAKQSYEIVHQSLALLDHDILHVIPSKQ